MQRALRAVNYSCHSPANKPQLAVKPGEVFVAETELCSGDWLHSIDDLWAPEKRNALNPTVVVYVEGANPGDLLAVEILEVVPDKLGYTGLSPEHNKLMNKIMEYDWGMNTKTVAIADGHVLWSDKLKLPISPMVGTLGTAPAEGEIGNAYGGMHGGNMDAQELCAGTTVFLPVEVEGALLHIGDCHALQGDG